MRRSVLPIASHPHGFKLTDEPDPLPAVPGQRIVMSADLGADFLPERVMIKNGRSWVINDVQINGESILDGGSLDGALLASDAVPAWMDDDVSAAYRRLRFRPMKKGERLTIIATFQGGDGVEGKFWSAVCGLSPDTESPCRMDP